jgi:peptide/nickel transport system ATP-binding protein
MSYNTTSASADSKPKASADKKVVLDVTDLHVHYDTPRGAVIAVNGINFNVLSGETVGLVGESGCGKTTTAMAILRMIQTPGRLHNGSISINGKELATLNDHDLRPLRWTMLSLIPQGAMNSLNPVMRIKDQIRDVITTHEGKQSESALKPRILELLNQVGLPARIYSMYPHELSGGMKQRVCVAMAIALNPPLIIADEPTSALDVVVQRVVAQTLMDVKKRLGVSMILIGHDMGLQAQLVDRIIVMYAGNIVENAPVKGAFKTPLHPYTQLLIAAIPSIKIKQPLKVTEGLTHDLRNPPPGCVFQFRCPLVQEHCRVAKPILREYAPGHFAACHVYENPEKMGTQAQAAAFKAGGTL